MRTKERGAVSDAPSTSRRQAAGHPDGNPEPCQKLVRAKAFAASPTGRRTLWTLVVPRCPFCSHLHLHRATGPHPGRRVGSCGESYFVLISGSKRSRWSR
ncbi:MAG: hypothetical protein LC799_05850 [Actinobacteria bacterium]|nr:hypothetical protein [Actinomycetota bacterium]